jgi:TPR repeat protein
MFSMRIDRVRLAGALGVALAIMQPAMADDEKAGNKAETEQTIQLPAPTDTIDKPSEPVPSRFGARAADDAFGAFQRGLYITAHNLALPRAKQGDAAAQTLLAEIYARGLGRPRDGAAARRWYELAAAQGVAEAEFRYGLILLDESSREKDEAKRAEARKLMEKAARAGNPLASFNMAQLILSERPGDAGRQAAYPHFLEAAKKNVADAQYAVAQYHINGIRPVFSDLEKGAYWLMEAAQRNFDTAQYEIGQMLLSGLGMPRDYEAGFGWILRAARAGNVAARAELAKLYWAGIGTEPDNERAAAWYVLARRAGFRDTVLDTEKSHRAGQRAVVSDRLHERVICGHEPRT